MPPKFMFPETQRLWVPLAPYFESTPRDDRALQVFARMKPGVTVEQARPISTASPAASRPTYPNENEGWGAVIRPLRDWMMPEQVELMILAMMGAVTLVLLIACSNVANLLLARASVRHREISIRAALGAGRLRIIRQLLTEAVMIGLLSAPLGIVLAGLAAAARPRHSAGLDSLLHSLGARRPLARLHDRDLAADRHRVRAGAGAAGRAQQPAGQPQGGRRAARPAAAARGCATRSSSSRSRCRWCC